MPHTRIARMTGLKAHQIESGLDHHPHHEVVCATMTDHEMHEYLEKEARELEHPHMRGKKF